MPLLRAMKLYEQDDAILIVSSDPSIKAALRIVRDTGAITECERPSALRGQSLVIFGIGGIIGLNSGNHIVVITSTAKVGRLHGKDVFLVRTTKTVSLAAKSARGVSEAQLSDDQQYQALLADLLSRNPFYFSYDLDITNTAQRIADSPHHDAPLHQRVDRRFFWNHCLVEPLVAAGVHDWVLPIMMGHIDIQNGITLSGKKFDFALISRRSIHRAGMRYVVRGIDEQGNVANYVETEQLLVNDSTIASFVQTRGSIPVFWAQKANLKYKPKPELLRNSDAALPYTRAHFEEQERIYGRQIAVNLIDQKGSELVLAQAYSEQVKKLGNPNITYVPFDFHTECKAMKYENISKLVKQIEAELQANGYFWSENGKVVKRQTGVVRTNCMDNLDRSNVVQSVIARHALRAIFSEFSVGENADFEQRFKTVWANNADAISMQYTGTGALKTDYTRTGKRSISGVLDDGIKSASRYYLNNFSDGARQDAFDLFLGNYRVDPSRSPFAKPQKNFPLVVAAFLAILVVALLLASFKLLPVSVSLVVVAWVLGLAGFVKIAMSAGTEWVNSPRLITQH